MIKPGIDRAIPTLVNVENINDVFYPILCIKLILQEGSPFVYIPHQTIILCANNNELFIHKIGQMGESDLIDVYGLHLLPGWCLLWTGRDKKYRMQFNKIVNYFYDNNEQLLIRDAKSNAPILHFKLPHVELDQEPEGSHYTVLLPPIIQVLEGNAPEQLVQDRLLARFSKVGRAETICIPTINEKVIEEIHRCKGIELLAIKAGALELQTDVYLIPSKVPRERPAVAVRSIRRSLSSKCRFPHLVPSFESTQQEADIICLRILCGQIHCDYIFIPNQVIIMDKANQLLIFYLGLLSEIHSDMNPNVLHLPGISIIVQPDSQYCVEIDINLTYAEDYGHVINLNRDLEPAAPRNEIQVSHLPTGGLLLEGQKPAAIRASAIQVTYTKTGHISIYKATVQRPVCFPRPVRAGLSQQPNAQASAGSELAPAMQNMSVQQAGASQAAANPRPQRRLAEGRFLFLEDKHFTGKKCETYLWNLLQNEIRLQKISRVSRPDLNRRLCIELTFTDRTKMMYLPSQHIVYCKEQNPIWMFEFCPVFYNSEGVIVFGGVSMRKVEDDIEILLNAHYRFNANGELQKLEENSLSSDWCFENLYGSPTPLSSDVLSGQTPPGLTLKEITVCLPIRSALLNFGRETSSGYGQSSGSNMQRHALKLPPRILRTPSSIQPPSSSATSTSSLDTMPTQMSGGACGFTPKFAAGPEQRHTYKAGGIGAEFLPSSELHCDVGTGHLSQDISQHRTPLSRHHPLAAVRRRQLNPIGSDNRSSEKPPSLMSLPPPIVCKLKFHVILGNNIS